MAADENLNHGTTKIGINSSINSEYTKEISFIKQNVEIIPENNTLIFTVPIYKKFKIEIYKPMIGLKLAFFFWFGGASVIQPFLTVFYKQRGITISELSIMYTITPVVQLLGSTLSGIIADKLGRSKPVLMGNLILCILFAGVILVIPNMNNLNCNPQPALLRCHQQEHEKLVSKAECGLETGILTFDKCKIHCQKNVTMYCVDTTFCQILQGGNVFSNFSLDVHIGSSYEIRKECYYNIISISHQNTTYMSCGASQEIECDISCVLSQKGKNCLQQGEKRKILFIINFIMMIMFTTFLSNTYRFMDVISMTLVKEHNADYGRERIWAIIAVIFFSPMSGYIIGALSPEGGPDYYDAAFYLFCINTILTMVVCWKLKVQINPPSKKMWRQSAVLLKSFDFVSFLLVIFVLGTMWAFNKLYLFWYLKELNATSLLLGLNQSFSQFYGLPFLIFSNWWIKTLGTANLFAYALMGYAVGFVAYSLIQNPWMSLLLEMHTVVSYHLLWVAVILHCHHIASKDLRATVMATAGGLHYGIGRGSGSLIGGKIIDHFTGPIAYRIMGAICFASAILYGFYLSIRRIFFNAKYRKSFTVKRSMDTTGKVTKF